MSNKKFERPWNTTGRTWIEVGTPGPWAVDNTLRSNSWGIINTETGETKRIGPVHRAGSRSRVNYFDRASEEANRRNAVIAAKLK